jgi:flagellum-specific peptidoglycan hydrolase FlgJ/LysM repeat protein
MSRKVDASHHRLPKNLTAAEVRDTKAIATLDTKQKAVDAQINQLEQALPSLKNELDTLRNRLDRQFSVERSAIEAKLAGELLATGTPSTSTPARSPAKTKAGATKPVALPRSSNAFVNELAAGAVAAQKKYGVPASVTIAQAILESGWGKSSLSRDAHNLFGIKGSGPAGSITVPTKEFLNGKWVTVNAAFRRYHSDAESIADHAKLLAESGYYRKAMGDKGNANRFADDLTGVYATDPNYGQLLKTIMKENDLYKYDDPKLAGAGSSGGAPAPSTGGTGKARGGGKVSGGGKTSGGGSVTVQAGDTLGAIASRNGVSLSALEAANPQIKNANLIYPGEVIHLPGGARSSGGGKTSGGKSSGGGKVSGGGKTSGTPSSGRGGDQGAYDAARSVLGQNISSLKYNGPLAKYLDKWPGNNVCCANFVCACLQDAGLLRASQHTDSVAALNQTLANDGNFKKVSLQNAKPGDVVIMNVPGEGPYGHVVMFAGWKNGSPQFIGSNNANADGTQRITEVHMGYGITAVYEHV